MKIWTYKEMVKKIEADLDLEDETFISPDEMAGYFNEALNEAESEIMVLNQDYLRAKAYLPLVQGVRHYDLPYNIYATKIRGIMYKNGSIIYPVPQYRRKGMFEQITYTEVYGQPDDYRYVLSNEVPGQARLEFHPLMRDTAVIYPQSSITDLMTLWFIRNCARVPMLGEFCNPEVITSVPTAQVSTLQDSIVTFAGLPNQQSYGQGKYGNPNLWNPGPFPGSIVYVTGDQVQFQPGPNSTLPAPLVAGVTYYVIATGAAGGLGTGLTIKLATTLQNAFAGTVIDITTTGTGLMTMMVACTEAIRQATLIDIPEFATFIMQWAKCRCYEKESDPRLESASAALGQQKAQMVSTLVKGIDDDDDKIQMDFSTYEEMS